MTDALLQALRRGSCLPPRSVMDLPRDGPVRVRRRGHGRTARRRRNPSPDDRDIAGVTLTTRDLFTSFA